MVGLRIGAKDRRKAGDDAEGQALPSDPLPSREAVLPPHGRDAAQGKGLNRLERWLLVKALKHYMEKSGMRGFFEKFFSTDSILSRIARAILLALAGAAATPTGGGDLYGLHLPTWLISVAGFVAGMIPAGQNNSSSTLTPPKA